MIRNKVKKFELDYNRYFLRKVKKIKDKYPEITSESRRTGKALKNICFFTWSYAEHEGEDMIDLLLKTSVLISAQDDFYDNLHVGDKQKIDFYSASKDIIEKRKYKSNNNNQQLTELLNLWQDIVKEINNLPSYLFDYWQKKAIDLNKAMIIENNILRNHNITLSGYMSNSTNSIGVIFLWTTYLVKKKVPKFVINNIDELNFIGAKVARLSNDLASYRRKKNKINAVILMKRKNYSKKYILDFIEKEQSKFNGRLTNLSLDSSIKKSLRNSLDFLVKFYQKSDFD